MKICLCLELAHIELATFAKKLEEMSFKKGDEIHFVHVFKKNVYADNFAVATYPSEEEETGIKESVTQSIKALVSDLPIGAATPIIDCLFSIAPKEAMAKYISDHNIEKNPCFNQKET
jgi:hypothetical protein